MRELFEQVMDSGVLHRPLPINEKDALEQLGLQKPVILSRVLCDMKTLEGWRGKGAGSIAHCGRITPKGAVSLRLEQPTVSDTWPQDAPSGDYTPFSRQFALYDTGGQNWEEYNRVLFYVYPDCPGARTVNIDLIFRNEGKIPVPDAYGREGRHEVNLINRQWNACFLEIPQTPRDHITMIGFESAAFGKDTTTGDTLAFDIGEIILQSVQGPEVVSGWQPPADKIVYAMTGYALHGKKTAFVAAAEQLAEPFFVRDAQGAIAYSGIAQRQRGPLGEFDIMDFSPLSRPGQYTLHKGALCTRSFAIDENVWHDSVWKALNFVFTQRCGMPVCQKHGTCHGDVIARHNGLLLAYNGGWHDAGDLSQQTLQTADTLFALMEAAAPLKKGDPLLHLRLMEEAEWGVDFILKCRMGGGYRASSAGIVNWSDGLIGNMDDQPARVHNNAFDNFLYAGYEAYASMAMGHDPMLAEKLAATAREDYAFALAAHAKEGWRQKPCPWEHSYETSPSLYQAVGSWCASLLFKMTGEARYAANAARWMEYTLRCQRTEPLGESGIRGFFYRDDTRRVIQHFSHQSREQYYMLALRLLLETQPGHPDASKWAAAVALYAGYIKKLAEYTMPYGMLPSGIYHIDENQDAESFEKQHRSPGAHAMTDFTAQVKAGVKLDDAHYLRRFPVWFSFRGNSAVHLAMGKAAAVCGRLLNDDALIHIAHEQLSWIVGKNPFCQSLMYGEGHNYPQQAVFLPGLAVGQMPVGIQTRGNDDLPYWPQANNATYKEAWLTVGAKWLSLTAELMQEGGDP